MNSNLSSSSSSSMEEYSECENCRDKESVKLYFAPKVNEEFIHKDKGCKVSISKRLIEVRETTLSGVRIHTFTIEDFYDQFIKINK